MNFKRRAIFVTELGFWAYAAGIMSMALALASCTWMKSPQKRVAESRSEISADYKAELERQSVGSGRGTLEVSWPQAMEKMYMHNPELIRADNLVKNARQQQTQLWKRMIPGFGLGASDSFSVGDLGDAFTSPSLRIYSYLSLGNLLDLPKDIYTQKLYYMGAELQAENTMRQQVISLHRIFQQQRLLDLEKRALDLEQQLVRGVSGLEGSEVLAMKLQQREAEERWRQSQQQWRTKVGDFFMANYDHIDLDPRNIPDICYKSDQLDFSDTGRWALLQLNLLALEKIAEDGRVAELYFRYIPRANFSVSAPPLYSNSGNQEFDPAAMNVSPAMNWNMDTTGSISQQLDRVKSNQAITDWRKDKRQHEEIKALLDGKKALVEVQAELAKTRAAMSGYQKAVKTGLVKDPRVALQTMRKLREREVRLAAREIEICTSFWLIDEERWTSITRRWQETRKIRAAKRK